MKMILVAAVIGLAACGGTQNESTVPGLWSFQVGADQPGTPHQGGILDLNEDGTGRATSSTLGPCFMCGPVKWSATGQTLRVDFYTVNTNFPEPSLQWGEMDLRTLQGTFHAPSYDGETFTAFHLP